MKRLLAIIYASAFTTLFTLAGHEVAFADEAIDHLSLGHGNMFQIVDDPKKPALCLLTAKYGFNSLSGFSPYLGTGLAYTLQPESKSGDNARISTGIAAQAGFSFLLGENSYLNIDYKYLLISPETHHCDTPPQNIGVGVTIKF